MEALGVGTTKITVRFDDDFSGDNDFDDQIIEVTLIYPSGTKSDEKLFADFDNDASGPTGSYTYTPPPPPFKFTDLGGVGGHGN
jgi:hypothetical protein